MYSEIITSQTFNNIVFEGRNKNYGAFYLRKEYEKHIRRAGLIMLFFLSVIAILSFVKLASQPIVKQKILDGVKLVKVILPPTVRPPHLIITPPTTQPPASVNGQNLNLVVRRNTEVMNTTPHEAPTAVGNPNGNSIGQNPLPTTTSGNSGTETSIPNFHVETNEPMIFVDEMPEFPGGEDAMIKYLQEKIRFTDQAKNLVIEGKVVLNFVVDEEGKICNCQVKRALGAGLDEIAINVVSKMPHWKPGKQHGKAVAVLFTLPIDFEQP